MSVDEPNALPDPAVTVAFPADTELTPRQESLREALAAHSAEAALLYVAGLRVLTDPHNPCSVRLASTAMRELIDQLAADRGVAGLRGEPAKGRINNLREQVRGLTNVLQVPQPSRAHVGRLLDLLGQFFQRDDEINPSRKRKAILVVTAISVAADSPAMILEAQADRLLELSGRFSSLLHGSLAEFATVLADFEDLLLDLLTPQTFADYAIIDQLIAEGPPDV